MGFVFTWLGAFQVAVTLVALGVAALVVGARPDRFQNRALAAVLVLFGLMGLGSQGILQLTDDLALARASQALLYGGGAAVAFVYLAFLGTLPTPLGRPFGGRLVRGLLLAMAAFWGVLAAALSPDLFVAQFVRAEAGVWRPVLRPSALLLFLVVAAVVLVGFAAALDMLRRAPRRGVLRQQALIYAAAFGIRDAWYVGALLAIPLVQGNLALTELLLYQFPALTLFVTALLGYGILVHQMFDIHLKLKLAVEKSTVLAAFAVAFLVVSELVERVLAVEGLLFGLAAAVGVGLVFRRVEGVARRVADRAMPGVRDTEEYRMVRKREVYRAALEGALADGTITERERAILVRLQGQLGLSAAEALSLEREAAA